MISNPVSSLNYSLAFYTFRKPFSSAPAQTSPMKIFHTIRLHLSIWLFAQRRSVRRIFSHYVFLDRAFDRLKLSSCNPAKFNLVSWKNLKIQFFRTTSEPVDSLESICVSAIERKKSAPGTPGHFDERIRE